MSEDYGASRKHKEDTHLSLNEDWEENIRKSTVESPRSNNKEKADGVKGTGFNKYGDDGLTHTYSPGEPMADDCSHMQGDPYDDHECEEDVERKGNRKVYGAKVAYCSIGPLGVVI